MEGREKLISLKQTQKIALGKPDYDKLQASARIIENFSIRGYAESFF